MFKCSTCGSSMRPLFTTYYCTTCDKRPGDDVRRLVWRPLGDGRHMYMLLKTGDIIPPDIIGGWHVTRELLRRITPERRETDFEMTVRVQKEWEHSGPTFVERGGWPIRDYFDPGTKVGHLSENSFVMVSKPMT